MSMAQIPITRLKDMPCKLHAVKYNILHALIAFLQTEVVACEAHGCNDGRAAMTSVDPKRSHILRFFSSRSIARFIRPMSFVPQQL